MILWLSSLTALFATTASVRTWDTLTARYSACPFRGFYNLPLTLQATESENYYTVDKLEEFNVTVHCQPHEPRVCLLFDTYGNIAGVRVTFLDKDLNKESLRLYGKPIPYNYSLIPMISQTVTEDEVGWSAYALFVDPVQLKFGGRSRVEAVANGIYAKIDGRWIEVSKDECTVTQQGFREGKCKFGRGMHYFPGTNLEFEGEDYQPFFATYNKKDLVGFGFAGLGSWTSGPHRVWFERKPFFGGYVSLIPADCRFLNEWARRHEFSVIHFYLVKGAYFMGCCTWFDRKCEDPDTAIPLDEELTK